jgi:monothiol glutaredoxin
MENNALNKIKEEINPNELCLFMKGTPQAPQCGFSLAVSNVLKHLEIKFKGVNVLDDPEVRQSIKQFSEWPTIPQLYIKGEFVGGCDIIKEMFESGELQKFLKDKKILYKSQ